MEPTEHNRQAWDDVHRRRGDTDAGGAGLPPPVRHALADLHGKRVLALDGADIQSPSELAGLGATVTALVVFPELVAPARVRWPKILWIEGELESLPRELRHARFDLVYAGWNAELIHDVDAWASGIAAALHSGGDLLLYDEHPAAKSVDGLMHWRVDYFHGDEPGERLLRLGQVVTAVARAGFTVRALEEYPQQPGNARHHDARIPGTFLLHARRQ